MAGRVATVSCLARGWSKQGARIRSERRLCAWDHGYVRGKGLSETFSHQERVTTAPEIR
jgi:hypothetical protein